MPPLSQSANANGLVVFANTYVQICAVVYVLLHGSPGSVLFVHSTVFVCPSPSQSTFANGLVGFTAKVSQISTTPLLKKKKKKDSFAKSEITWKRR